MVKLAPDHLSRTNFSIRLASETDFAGWRNAARDLALADIAPEAVTWHVGEAGDLFGTDAAPLPRPVEGRALTVPRAFVERAEAVICHSDPERFSFLYRMLWRQIAEPKLLSVASDPDVIRLQKLEKAVRRDIHKMRAFVRFVEVKDGDGEPRYVAWFEPDHYIVERNAPFFQRRFTGMRWSILTPKGCAHWDGEELSFTELVSRDAAPAADATDDLWRTYFASIFNPARLKVKAMQAEMPKKYWRNLPEASLIPDLVKGAEKAARRMIETMPTMPAPHHRAIQEKHWPELPEPASDEVAADTLAGLARQAEGCRRCPLWREATQTVFGEGPEGARIVFVGEQPGDQEDLAGKPFVGPAGRVFDAVLEEAGVERSITYVTNAVKHFKFEPRGKRRIHSKPNAGEVQACRWWVEHEIGLIRPDLAVAMGATAALSLLGKAIPVTKMRGEIVTREDGLRVFLTIHPSFILRIREPADAAAERARFVEDMKAVKRLMAA